MTWARTPQVRRLNEAKIVPITKSQKSERVAKICGSRQPLVVKFSDRLTSAVRFAVNAIRNKSSVPLASIPRVAADVGQDRVGGDPWCFQHGARQRRTRGGRSAAGQSEDKSSPTC